MSYNAVVIPVMIASPSDVSEEREIIRQVIHEWNYINSQKTQIVILPVGWETHIAPQTGDSPQNFINKYILKDCDLLIGVFWTRIGTETNKAESGTVEEINEHIETGKPAMIYFSDKVIQPKDMKDEQYKKVAEFKRTIKDKAIYDTYCTTDEFKDKLKKHLEIIINQNEYIKKLIRESQIFNSENNVTKSIELSTTEKRIINMASRFEHGQIMIFNSSSGGKEIGGLEVPLGRELSAYEDALERLIIGKILKQDDTKGEIFSLTRKGWEISDKLEK